MKKLAAVHLGKPADVWQKVPDDLETGSYDLETGPDDLQTGSYDLETGPDDLQAGPYDLQTGPDDLQAGFYDLQRGPNDLQTTPYDWQPGPNDLQMGLYDLKMTGTIFEKPPDVFKPLPGSLSEYPGKIRSSLTNQLRRKNGFSRKKH